LLYILAVLTLALLSGSLLFPPNLAHSEEDHVSWAKKLAARKLDSNMASQVMKIAKQSEGIVADALGDALSVDVLSGARSGSGSNTSTMRNGNSIYVFVSLSQHRQNLVNLAREAKNLGATLVLRGLKENSYKKTAIFLSKIIEETGSGFIVDPILYRQYGVEVVPTFVMSNKPSICPQTSNCGVPKHNKLSGNVTLQFALRELKKKGAKL
jgi:type-F conjugative transfer system pilin assembly protein TrbC